MNNLVSDRGEVVRSMSDYVYNTLRQAIVTRQLRAGERLVEAKVSKELNVSPTPVRHAFTRLENQGLLTIFPYKGSYVTVMSREYVEDLYELRLHLEALAAARGVERLTEEDFAYYASLFERSDRAEEQDDFFEAIRCDMLFHERIFQVSGSSVLMEVWDTIKYRIENIQAYTKPHRKLRLSARHQGMLDALRARDGDAYVVAMREHLKGNLDLADFPREQDVHYD